MPNWSRWRVSNFWSHPGSLGSGRSPGTSDSPPRWRWGTAPMPCWNGSTVRSGSTGRDGNPPRVGSFAGRWWRWGSWSFPRGCGEWPRFVSEKLEGSLPNSTRTRKCWPGSTRRTNAGAGRSAGVRAIPPVVVPWRRGWRRCRAVGRPDPGSKTGRAGAWIAGWNRNCRPGPPGLPMPCPVAWKPRGAGSRSNPPKPGAVNVGDATSGSRCPSLFSIWASDRRPRESPAMGVDVDGRWDGSPPDVGGVLRCGGSFLGGVAWTGSGAGFLGSPAFLGPASTGRTGGIGRLLARSCGNGQSPGNLGLGRNPRDRDFPRCGRSSHLDRCASQVRRPGEMVGGDRRTCDRMSSPVLDFPCRRSTWRCG